MTLVKETDYGTPASRSEKTVTLTIDGARITVPEGTSIMRAAMEMGTQIPKLRAATARLLPARRRSPKASSSTPSRSASRQSAAA
jgi:hypothetical protein